MSRSRRPLFWGILLVLVLSNVICVILLLKATASQTVEGVPSAVPTVVEENRASEPLAKVGEEIITKAELTDRLLQQYGHKVLEEMINHQVVEAEAKRLKITIADSELEQELNHLRQDYLTEAEFEEALENQVGISKEELREEIRFYLLAEELATHDIVISEEQITQYYHENRDAFYEPTRFHLHRILVATEQEALEVLAEIMQGSSFEAVASERSLDLFTAADGGDMGVLTSDSFFLPYEIIRIAEELPLHELSEPIPAEEGFSIIKVTQRVAGGERNLAEVRERIRRELALKEIDGLNNFIDRLREKAKVEVYLES